MQTACGLVEGSGTGKVPCRLPALENLNLLPQQALHITHTTYIRLHVYLSDYSVVYKRTLFL
eukprot:scaffold149351_cov24-Prasinocladus_malaysianus.AAC.1